MVYSSVERYTKIDGVIGSIVPADVGDRLKRFAESSLPPRTGDSFFYLTKVAKWLNSCAKLWVGRHSTGLSGPASEGKTVLLSNNRDSTA